MIAAVLIAAAAVLVVAFGSFRFGCLVTTGRAEQARGDQAEAELAARPAPLVPLTDANPWRYTPWRPVAAAVVTIEPDTMPMRIIRITPPQDGELYRLTSPGSVELAVSWAARQMEEEIRALADAAERKIGAIIHHEF